MTSRFPSAALVAVWVYATAVFGCAPGGTGRVDATVVFDGLDDASGVEVSLEGPIAKSLTTGADGSVHFDGLAAGSYALVADAPATEEGTETTVVDVTGSATAYAGVLVFHPVGAIEGQVRRADGEPLPAGVSVTVAGTSSATTADPDGHYALGYVPIGLHDVVASASDGEVALVPLIHVRHGKRTSVPDLVLAAPSPPVAKIEGRVVLDGVDDRSGIPVTLSGEVLLSTVTDATGAYAFSSVPAGRYTLSAAAASTIEGVVSTPITVLGGNLRGPDLVLTPSGSVAGTARLADATVGNGGITILVRSANRDATSVTDDAGRYSVRGVPLGAVEVEAVHTGFQVASAQAGPVGYGTVSTVADLTLVPDASSTARATIRGVATLAGDVDPSGLVVTVSDDLTSFPPVTVSSDGVFAVSDVPAGIYRVDLARGPYQETIPRLLAIPGETAVILDRTSYPLSTIEVPRARRFASTGPCGQVVVSPDGRHVAYQTGLTYPPYSPVAYIASIDGSPPVVARRMVLPGRLMFTPDGSHLLVIDSYDGRPTGFSVTSIPVDGGPGVTLAVSARGQPLVTPDGKRVLVVVNTSATTGAADLESVPIDGGAATVLSAGAVGAGPSMMSGDGSQVLFLAQTGVGAPIDLWLAPVAGGTPTLVGSGVSGELVRTPDGASALFAGGGTLASVRLADGSVNVIGTGAPTIGTSATFTPDGSTFVYVDPVGTLVGAPLAGGTALHLAVDVFATNAQPVLVAPPDRIIYFTGIHALGRATLWTVSMSAPTPVQIATDVRVDSVQLTPSGDRIVYSGGSGDIYIVPTSGGPSVRLAPALAAWSVTLTPDGTTAVLASGTIDGPSALWSVPLSGAAPIQIASDAVPSVMTSDGQDVVALVGPTTAPRLLEAVPTDGSAATPIIHEASVVQMLGGQALLERTQAPMPFQEGFYLAPVP